nr:hypothetical protein [Kibdelosporangium sp. MJ126-NF4]CEL19109.1 hypothetical protein [Kibdelosporangium sp. MJ126-NF4]CTQ95089.1 hypothetical protein [Kibdelosporangium sp. MJ126-NF4]
MTFTALVAQPPPMPDDPGGRGEDFGKSSPVGLLVLLVFIVAVVFLARSMSKHLKRVPASFDKPEDKETAEATDKATDGAADEATDGDAPAAEPKQEEQKNGAASS